MSAFDPLQTLTAYAKVMQMTSGTLTIFDMDVRGELTRAIAELGYAPSNEQLARRLGMTVSDVEDALSRLHEAHALLLHPNRCAPWAVHPFALSPGSCWVETEGRGWWANCLYCGMGIAAALEKNADIHTRIGGESEPIVVRISGGDISEPELLFHLSTPVREWWDNVIHACASFQPFRCEADIDAWCERHAMRRGAVVPLRKMWSFAADWYGGYLRRPWRKRSLEETKTLFAKHEFGGQFWRLEGRFSNVRFPPVADVPKGMGAPAALMSPMGGKRTLALEQQSPQFWSHQTRSKALRSG